MSDTDFNIRSLQAENNRLREALEKITVCTMDWAMISIATKA